MSHHVSVSPSNPTGAVEVVRTSSSSATTAPVDGGGSAGAAVPAATGTTTPVPPVSTPAAGQSGTPGASLPVDGIQQASNTIQGAQADLSRTTGAERRLDGFDGVGGDGGGGEADPGVADEGAQDAVAAGTDDLNVSDQDGGIGAERDMGEQNLTTTAEDNPNQAQQQRDPRSAL